MARLHTHLSTGLLLAGLVAGSHLDATPLALASQDAPAPASPQGAPASPQAAPAGSSATIADRLNALRPGVLNGTEPADKAIAALQGILAEDPMVAEAHLLLGLSYLNLGQREMLAEAKAELRQALDLDPRFIPAHYFLAQVYLQFDLPEEARTELQAALDKVPNYLNALALLGEVERRLNNPARALELTGQALRIDARFQQAHYYHALALLDSNRTDEGVRELEALVRDGARVPDIYVSLGSAYLELGRAADAADVLVTSLELDDTLADARVLLARAYRLTGDLDRGDAELARVTIVPNGVATSGEQARNAQVYIERGLIRLAQGRLDDAEAALSESLLVDPNLGVAHKALAEVYFKKGAFDQSSQHAVRAEQLGSPLSPAERQAIDAAVRQSPRGQR